MLNFFHERNRAQFAWELFDTAGDDDGTIKDCMMFHRHDVECLILNIYDFKPLETISIGFANGETIA